MYTYVYVYLDIYIYIFVYIYIYILLRSGMNHYWQGKLYVLTSKVHCMKCWELRTAICVMFEAATVPSLLLGRTKLTFETQSAAPTWRRMTLTLRVRSHN